VTRPSADGGGGVELFFFPSGQVEAHAPGGTKDIRFPEGIVRRVHPDGREGPGPARADSANES
jgi:hypothetical protein